MADILQIRRDTAAVWTLINPILYDGELGLEIDSDPKKLKIGDGTTAWSDLPYFLDYILEFADLASFPGTGETGKIYVAIDTNKIYHWTGSVYGDVGGSSDLQAVTDIGNITTNDIIVTDGTNNSVTLTKTNYAGNFGGTILLRNPNAHLSQLKAGWSNGDHANFMPNRDGTLACVEDLYGRYIMSTSMDYTPGITDWTVIQDGLGRTITLPDIATMPLGKIFVIKTGPGVTSCTVATTSSQTIDGATTYTLSAPYKYVTVQSAYIGGYGNWIIIGTNVSDISGGSGNGMLIDFITDAPNDTTTTQTVYSYTMPANTLANDGDKLLVNYNGLFNTGGTTKAINLLLFGSGYAPPSTTYNGTFIMQILITRTSSTTANLQFIFNFSNLSPFPIIYSVTGIDFTSAILIALELQGVALNDITAKSGFIQKIPAA